VRALVVKGQSILLRTWTLRPDNAVEPVHHQNSTKRGSRANDGERLFALITFKFSAKITHTHGKPTPGDFHPDRSGGHVVPWWHSPDVMVRVSSEWKSPHVMVSVSSSENHPTLWLGWKLPHVMVRVSFCFPVDALTCKNWQNSTNYSFHISIWGDLEHFLGRLSMTKTPVATELAVCETWKSIAVSRSTWLPSNCRKAFAHFGQVYLVKSFGLLRN